MTEFNVDFAHGLSRYADECERIGVPVLLAYDPIAARQIAEMIERGARRSYYVREVQAEAERLRDAAEEMMLAAQDANAAADRALERARMQERRAWRVYWVAFAFLIVWGAALAVLA